MSETSKTEDTLLRVEELKKHFTAGNGLLENIEVHTGNGFPIQYNRDVVRAVDDVSFEIKRGETLGMVGESGCGKSTLGRTILRLLEPTEGAVYFKSQNVAEFSKAELRATRREQQIIFQDPQSSLNPRMKVGPIVEEPMKAHDMYDDDGREARARELLQAVGLDPQHYNRYPHQFSGGQRQRINLARALSVNPDFIVCDEPTSALDASIQAQVLNTMRELQEEFELTYLFISHDLSVIRHISDRVAVMYLGKLVEVADKQELFEDPQHPYTKALLDSIPIPDPRASGRREVLRGDVPNPINPPSGCRFRTRCPALIAPERYDLTDEQWSAIKEFTRAVQRRTFEPAGQTSVYERFFDDVSLNDDVADIVNAATADVAAKHWEEATERLTTSFIEQSICSIEEPSYVIDAADGGERYVACHLHR